MILSPIIINVSATSGNPALTAFMAYFGYTWMAVLFLFFSIHFLIDIYNAGIAVLRKFFPDFLRLRLKNAVSFTISIVMVMGIITYGSFEASKIGVKTVILKTEKLPPTISRIRIVQISDIHFSATNGVRLAQKIVDIIKGLDPEILVSTGDFIDRGLNETDKVADLFRGITARYGKYAVTGNHEFYRGIKEAVQFTETAGFRMLRNQGITIYGVVNLAGVDDPTAKRFGLASKVSEDEILRKLPPDKITILLKHQPRINENSVDVFDLQLSGHTHNGQIFPFRLISSLFFPYNNGFFTIGNHAHLYVSSGTGTWGPPVRFLSPPEITVIEFRRKE